MYGKSLKIITLSILPHFAILLTTFSDTHFSCRKITKAEAKTAGKVHQRQTVFANMWTLEVILAIFSLNYH